MRPLFFSLLFILFSFSTYSQTLDSLENKVAQEEYRILNTGGSEPFFLRAKRGASILDEPSETGKVLLKLEEAQPILEILSFTENYFRVCLEQECGYLTFHNAELNPQSEIYKAGMEIRKEKILKQGI